MVGISRKSKKLICILYIMQWIKSIMQFIHSNKEIILKIEPKSKHF